MPNLVIYNELKPSKYDIANSSDLTEWFQWKNKSASTFTNYLGS